MSLTLDLKPEVETALRDHAAERGVSISDLLALTFPPRRPSQNPSQSLPRKAPRLRVLPREQAKALNAPSIQRLAAELAVGARATPDEAAHAEAEWQEFARALNENRRATGERLLFADPAQPATTQP